MRNPQNKILQILLLSAAGFGCNPRLHPPKKQTETIENKVSTAQETAPRPQLNVSNKRYIKPDNAKYADNVEITHYNPQKNENVIIKYHAYADGNSIEIIIQKNDCQVEINGWNKEVRRFYISGAEGTRVSITREDNKQLKLDTGWSNLKISDAEMSLLYNQTQQKFDYYTRLLQTDINEVENYLDSAEKERRRHLQDAMELLK